MRADLHIYFKHICSTSHPCLQRSNSFSHQSLILNIIPSHHNLRHQFSLALHWTIFYGCHPSEQLLKLIINGTMALQSLHPSQVPLTPISICLTPYTCIFILYLPPRTLFPYFSPLSHCDSTPPPLSSSSLIHSNSFHHTASWLWLFTIQILPQSDSGSASKKGLPTLHGCKYIANLQPTPFHFHNHIVFFFI